MKVIISYPSKPQRVHNTLSWSIEIKVIAKINVISELES